MMIHCKDRAWFAPVSDLPAAEELHEKLLSTFGDILLSLVLMLCIRIGGTV